MPLLTSEEEGAATVPLSKITTVNTIPSQTSITAPLRPSTTSLSETSNTNLGHGIPSQERRLQQAIDIYRDMPDDDTFPPLDRIFWVKGLKSLRAKERSTQQRRGLEQRGSLQQEIAHQRVSLHHPTSLAQFQSVYQPSSLHQQESQLQQASVHRPASLYQPKSLINATSPTRLTLYRNAWSRGGVQQTMTETPLTTCSFSIPRSEEQSAGRQETLHRSRSEASPHLSHWISSSRGWSLCTTRTWNSCTCTTIEYHCCFRWLRPE
jgi:hypothetical protein